MATTYETKPDGDIVASETVVVQTSLKDLRAMKDAVKARRAFTDKQFQEVKAKRDAFDAQIAAIQVKIDAIVGRVI